MKSCSLDLCLSPMASTLHSCRRDSTDDSSLASRTNETNVFYNARLRQYDLVEIQVRAILEMASKEREETALAPVRLESPLGFPVKRSLERFLEKRKKRSKSLTPLSYTYTSTSSSSSHNF